MIPEEQTDRGLSSVAIPVSATHQRPRILVGQGQRTQLGRLACLLTRVSRCFARPNALYEADPRSVGHAFPVRGPAAHAVGLGLINPLAGERRDTNPGPSPRFREQTNRPARSVPRQNPACGKGWATLELAAAGCRIGLPSNGMITRKSTSESGVGCL